MKKTVVTLMSAAVLATSIAFAAPVFKFSTDQKANLMMMGQTIELSAYPKAKLLAKSISDSKASFVYAGSDASGVYVFYDKALKSEGWKDAPAMKSGDTMKTGDTMNKPADTMTKPADTMDKPAETMTKTGDTMKSGDTMMKGAEGMKMKDGSYQGHYTLKTFNLGLSTSVKDGKVYVNFNVK
jgi:uncharacterized protein with FMN-binding domain